MGGTQTDEDGFYQIGSIRPGTYLIAVSAGPQFRIEADKTKSGYPITWFYPGAPDEASATSIEIAPDQHFEADFVLPKQPVFDVKGQITGYPGEGGGVNIQLELPSGEGVPIVAQVEPRSRRFDLHQVPAGTYVLRASGSDEQGQEELVGQAQLTVNGDVSGVVVAVSPMPVIPVIVKTDFSHIKPSEMPHPAPDGFWQAVQVQLRGINANNLMAFTQPQGPPGEQTLVVRGARPGQISRDRHWELGRTVARSSCPPPVLGAWHRGRHRARREVQRQGRSAVIETPRYEILSSGHRGTLGKDSSTPIATSKTADAKTIHVRPMQKSFTRAARIFRGDVH